MSNSAWFDLNNTLKLSIGMTVSGRTKNPKVGAAITNILKSISGGKFLSLSHMHGRGLRLKKMSKHFK